MEPSAPLPSTPPPDDLARQSSSSPAPIGSKSSSGLDMPSFTESEIGAVSFWDEPIFWDSMETSTPTPDEQRLALPTQTARPVLQLFFKDTNQINYFDEPRGSDSELSCHLDDQIWSPQIQLFFEEEQETSDPDIQILPDCAMEPSAPLPTTPPPDDLARQSSSSPAPIGSKSSSGLDWPSWHQSESEYMVAAFICKIFAPIETSTPTPDEQRLALPTRSARPVLPLLFNDTNQINYFDEPRGSDSEFSCHLDDQIWSPQIQLFFEEEQETSDPDIQIPLSWQRRLPSPPVPPVLFKEDKTASNLRFHPYQHLQLSPPHRESTPPLVAPVRAGKVVEGTVHDGTSIITSNPFAPSTSHHDPNSLESILHDQSSTPVAIPLHHLEKFTNNFSDERILGQGGSGVVYKGVLQNGEIIAVKKIMSSLMPGLQKKFENEVYHLLMLKHPNIVRCVGYSYEIKNVCLEYDGKPIFAEMAQRLLCFEYLPNGSLDKYISDESSGLDWSTRYKIIEGICHGLCHLHGQNGKPIVHLDLKPANILLDDDMAPKITDFGLSRLLDLKQTICTKSRDGTLGYMAPEFLHGGTITSKSDIFSLGVIILEIITGHRNYSDVTRTSSDEFSKLVNDKWRNVLQRSPCYGSLETDCQQIKRCIQVGLMCVDSDRTKRPPIADIINMLREPGIMDCDTSDETALPGMPVWL